MDIRKTAIIAIIAIVLVAMIGLIYISTSSANTKININCNDTLQNGEYILFELKDDYRHPIPNQILDLKILDDSGWAYKYNVTTDDLGRGYIQLAGFDNGNYTVHANFNGTLLLKESHENRAFKIDDGYGY